MMRVVLRSMVFIVLLLAGFAAWRSAQFLRGDRLIYSVPPPDASMNYAQAYYQQGIAEQGIKLNPMSWDGYIQIAAYHAIQQERASNRDKDREAEKALGRLAEARRYYTAIQGLTLEAALYADMQDQKKAVAEAIPRFEMLERISVMDRSVIQRLIKLYTMQKNHEKLRRVATEADMQWWYAFDTQVALGNAALDTGDIPLTFKYYLLAWSGPQSSYYLPKPRAFKLSDIKKRIPQASGILKYDSDWARWGEAAKR